MKIVATASLPAVGRLNADRWNAAHSRQLDYDLMVISLAYCIKYGSKLFVLEIYLLPSRHHTQPWFGVKEVGFESLGQLETPLHRQKDTSDF